MPNTIKRKGNYAGLPSGINYNAIIDSSSEFTLAETLFFWFCGAIGQHTTLSRCEVAGSSPVRTALVNGVKVAYPYWSGRFCTIMISKGTKVLFIQIIECFIFIAVMVRFHLYRQRLYAVRLSNPRRLITFVKQERYLPPLLT